MDKQIIKLKLLDIIRQIFNNDDDENQITEHLNLIEDLNMDSIMFISIIIEIENNFNIIIPDELLIMDNFKNVDDILNIILSANIINTPISET